MSVPRPKEQIDAACPAQPDLQDLSASLDLLSKRIETMVSFADQSLVWHREITKWLLIVVCVIALGKSALEIGEKFIKTEVAKAGEMSSSETSVPFVPGETVRQ